jgi:membrane protease YdiL (CAAX protease family)
LPTVRPSLREPLLTFLAAIVLASALFWLGKAVPLIHRNLHACIAVLFFYTPVVAGRLAKRPFDFHEAGLRLDPVRLNAAVLAAAIAVAFPLFVVAFFGFYEIVCGPGVAATGLDRLCPGSGWMGLRGGHLHLPPDFALLALNQVLVIALPEELFFRGYLQGRLEARWPPGRRFLGASVGRALLVSSVLFALGHFLVDFNPQRLAVFFPGLLFGWMRARTGSIAAGAAFHALCNLLADVLHTSYF